MARALRQVSFVSTQLSGRGDVGQQTNAAESAALKELSSQSHRRRYRGALDADQHQHGRPVRRIRVVYTWKL